MTIVPWINDVKVSTGGVVVARDLHIGNGIEFTDMAPEDRERLKHFLTAEADGKPAQGAEDQVGCDAPCILVNARA